MEISGNPHTIKSEQNALLSAAESRRLSAQALISPDQVLRNLLGYGAFVGVRYPYLYLETPKAACTTTKVHLWHLEQMGPLSLPKLTHLRSRDDPRQSLLTIGKERALEAMSGPSVFRFCVWRDPVRRLASNFMAKIKLGRDRDLYWDHYRKAIADAFGLSSEKLLTFDQFAQFVCAMPDQQRDGHLMSQWRLTLFSFVRYDRIVHVDRYADDMAEVYRSIGVPHAEWPDFTGVRANPTGSESIEVSETTAAMIRRAYGKDYEMIGQDTATTYRGISF